MTRTSIDCCPARRLSFQVTLLGSPFLSGGVSLMSAAPDRFLGLPQRLRSGVHVSAASSHRKIPGVHVSSLLRILIPLTGAGRIRKLTGISHTSGSPPAGAAPNLASSSAARRAMDRGRMTAG